MKRNVYISYGALLFWFALDMTGISFDDKILVTKSYSNDWIFLVAAVVSLMIFLFQEKIGKWVMLFWLTGWSVTQFIFHEMYTIVGGGESKIDYFFGTIKLITSEDRYIPDLYHIVLHVLIIASMIVLVRYIRKEGRRSK